MRAIFISYRRDDAEGQAGRLFDDLAQHFGADAVFMDVAAIEPGRDFRRVIDEQVASCGVLLAIIGRNWLTATDESGARRLDSASDFVRLETASALKRDIPVVPVLVHNAKMPRAEELPEDLRELAFRNGVELTHARWESDVQLLLKALRPYVQATQAPSAPQPLAAPQSPATPAAPVAPAAPATARKRPAVAIIAALIGLLVLALGGYAWQQKSSEAAAREAAAREAVAREAAAREAAAREAAAREAAAREVTAREAAAREVTAREAAAREAALAADQRAAAARQQAQAAEQAARKAREDEAAATRAEAVRQRALAAQDAARREQETKAALAAKAQAEEDAAKQAEIVRGRREAASGPSYRDWQGDWNLEWEYEGKWSQQPMKMTSVPAGVTANYGIGKFRGPFVNGDFSKISGRFQNTAGTGVDCDYGGQGGSYSLTMAANGKSLRGWWNVCGKGKQYAWKANKQ